MTYWEYVTVTYPDYQLGKSDVSGIRHRDVFRLPTLKVTYWEYQLMGLYSDNGTVTYWEYVTVTYSDYQLGKGDIL